MTNHLSDALLKSAPKHAVYLETLDRRRYTYGDLLKRSAQMANVLIDFGTKPGDRIAVQVEKSAEALLLYLACLRCGAVYLPLNAAYTLTELEYFITDSEPRLVVTSPQVAATGAAAISNSNVTWITLDGQGEGTLTDLASQASEHFIDVERSADDIAAILYTSGTTGRSKGAMLTHGNLLSNALTLRDTWRVTAADRLIHALPIFHAHGLFVAANVTMAAGASIIMLPKFDPDVVVSLLPRSTMMMGVPTFYVRLLQHDGLTRETTSGMRLFISGSAPLLAETLSEFRARTGHTLLERYGMTETLMNTSNPYEGDRVAGTVGLPLPQVSVRITDPATGVVLADGETGMIEIKGPNVFKGYWRMPDKTKADFREDGYFISGDLGKFDEAGYLHIVGRGKDLVISGGYNIYPKEVESEINRLSGVAECAVVGLDHPDFGEGVTAIVVRQDGSNLTVASIHAALHDRLARYKQPKQIIFVDELPRNAMGKVQKNLLREAYRGLYSMP